MLHKVSENCWIHKQDHTMLGLHLGTRMTVLKVKHDALLLHSPTRITAELKKEIDELGEVRHIVCPNLFHHMYAKEAKNAWPNALLHGHESIQKKRSDLAFDALLTETPHPDWAGILRPKFIRGCMLKETVFLQEQTGTLVTVDLIENFHQCDHGFTRLYLKMNGVYKKPGWARLLRPLYNNRKLAREDIQDVLGMGYEKLILAHGDIIESNAVEKTREGLSWLL